ncbi:hypothetical protein ACFL24_02200 [Patescibacteria group bacterium]
MIKEIIISILLISLAVLMLVKNKKFVDFFGKNSWAERHLGGGGTYTLFKIIALALIFFTLLYSTGMLDNFFRNTIGLFFPSLR